MAFLRKDKKGQFIEVVCNFSPVHREGYRVGVPFPGRYEVVFDTDDPSFGGAGLGNHEPLKSEYVSCHGQEQSIAIDLPPMSAVILRCVKKFPPRRKKAELKLETEPKKAVQKAAKSKAVKAGAKGAKTSASKAEDKPRTAARRKPAASKKAEKD